MWLAGETEILGENLPQRHFVHHKSKLPDPGANPGCRGGKPATNRLSYGTACLFIWFSYSYTLKMESKSFSETSVSFHHAALHIQNSSRIYYYW
jgi:hypothetical protein